MAEMERPDPSLMRVSDADRHRASEVLREAAGDGRLDFDELDERLEATYAAKTRADLLPVTADLLAGPLHLPVHRPASAPAVPAHQKSVAVMGDCKRRGEWTVPPKHAATAVMGDVVLDLRAATFQAPVTDIVATSVMGDIKILVNESTSVEIDGTPIMGDFEQRPDKTPAKLTPDSPTVRVHGYAVLGNVRVQRLPPPGTPRRFLGRY